MELHRSDKHTISERQKVTRKLKQTKKRLEKADSLGEKKTIAAEIQELSVDLNYVLVCYTYLLAEGSSDMKSSIIPEQKNTFLSFHRS